MSLLSHYRTVTMGRKVPLELALSLVRAMKGLSLEEEHKKLSEFAAQVVFKGPIEDMDELALVIDPDFLPEDDPMVKAIRERRIPLHSLLAFINYTNDHNAVEDDMLRARLAEEIEATYPLKKSYRKLHKRQEGKSEAEKQRLELEFHLEMELAEQQRGMMDEDEERTA